MSRLLIFIFISLTSFVADAQNYVLSKGTITFFSEAAIEDIKAENKKIKSLFNSSTGDIAFSLPNNEFQFEKKLMQQHFNEKYMESEKFPRSTFSGRMEGFSKSATGKQSVNAVGKLFIHGETREVNIPGEMEIQSGKIVMKSTFIIKLADYKIKIPQLLWQNIAEQVEVTIEIVYTQQ